jgi:hypothetical protein
MLAEVGRLEALLDVVGAVPHQTFNRFAALVGSAREALTDQRLPYPAKDFTSDLVTKMMRWRRHTVAALGSRSQFGGVLASCRPNSERRLLGPAPTRRWARVGLLLTTPPVATRGGGG